MPKGGPTKVLVLEDSKLVGLDLNVAQVLICLGKPSHTHNPKQTYSRIIRMVGPGCKPHEWKLIARIMDA